MSKIMLGHVVSHLVATHGAMHAGRAVMHATDDARVDHLFDEILRAREVNTSGTVDLTRFFTENDGIAGTPT